MELTEDAGKGVLNDHLVSKVSDVYARAIIHASCETGLPQEAFPRKCSYTLNQLLNPDLLAGWSLRLTDD